MVEFTGLYLETPVEIDGRGEFAGLPEEFARDSVCVGFTTS
jgi:hypothetical protein